MARSKVHVVVTGGTITMTRGSQRGIAPAIDGNSLLAAIPALADVADIEVSTPFLKPGASLSYADLAAIAMQARAAFAGGAHGVVVVQGTDTIDETSFFLDLMHRTEHPLVVTGAMRGAGMAGADGPANLLSSVIVAASRWSGLGVVTVLNDEIHSARLVEKSHTALPSAFMSPGFGPIGYVIEGEAQIVLRPIPIQVALSSETITPKPVAIVKIALADRAKLLSLAACGDYAGIVVEGMGAGHLPAQVLPDLDRAVSAVPVVFATRVPGGSIFRSTYGFSGGEIDLIGRGLIPAGFLSATKARLLLALLIGEGRSREQIRSEFSKFS